MRAVRSIVRLAVTAVSIGKEMAKRKQSGNRRRKGRARQRNPRRDTPPKLPATASTNKGTATQHEGGTATDQPRNEQPGRNGQWQTGAWLTLFFTGVVAAATFAQAFITSCQWNAMQDQLELMKIDQRPWLSISEPTLENFTIQDIVMGKPTVVKFKITNSGKTPAIVTEGNVSLLLAGRWDSTDKLIDGIDPFDRLMDPSTTQVPFAPNASLTFWITKDFHHQIDPEIFDTGPEVLLQKDGIPMAPKNAQCLWFIGRLRYVNAYGQRYEPAECCFRYDVRAKGFVPEGKHNK
jgi:hypothetical protein